MQVVRVGGKFARFGQRVQGDLTSRRWLKTRSNRDSQRTQTCRPTYSGGTE